MISRVWSLFLFLSIAGCATIPAVHPRSLTGTWTGEYSYSQESRAVNPPVSFKATLVQNGSKLEGMITESNSFDPVPLGSTPNPSYSSTLTATLHEGKIIGSHVEFRKQYNGESGYSHSVEYTGAYDTERDTVSGQWSLGQLVGFFSMRRLAK